jgi:hypothetical protein
VPTCGSPPTGRRSSGRRSILDRIDASEGGHHSVNWASLPTIPSTPARREPARAKWSASTRQSFSRSSDRPGARSYASRLPEHPGCTVASMTAIRLSVAVRMADRRPAVREALIAGTPLRTFLYALRLPVTRFCTPAGARAPLIGPSGSVCGDSLCNPLGIDPPRRRLIRPRSLLAYGPDGIRPSATARTVLPPDSSSATGRECASSPKCSSRAKSSFAARSQRMFPRTRPPREILLLF